LVEADPDSIDVVPLALPDPPDVRNGAWLRNTAMSKMREKLDTFFDTTATYGDSVASKVTGSIIAMGTHTSLDDPPNAITATWDRLHILPCVDENVRFTPGLKTLMNFVGALDVPTSEPGSGPEFDRLVEQIAEAIKMGHNVGWYPSGTVLRGNKEVLGQHVLLEKVLARLGEDGVRPPILVLHQQGMNGSPLSRISNNGNKIDDPVGAISQMRAAGSLIK